MIIKYEKYLEFLDNKLQDKFESQKDFIKCKKGCAYCCKEGQYPMSELEFVYLMVEYVRLSNAVKDKINENIFKLIESNRQKLYECPFLVDNICSVYIARPIICRTFGLISYNKNGNFKVPFCTDLGLNYSGTLNLNESEFDTQVPKLTAFNIEREVLRGKLVEREYGIYFGEDKSMIDWLREEFR